MSKIDNYSDYLAEVIESFRLGREGQGSAALAKLIDLLLPMLEQRKGEIVQDDIILLNNIITAQERGDYLYVADILEYLLPSSMLGKVMDIG